MSYQVQKDDCGKAVVRELLTTVFKDDAFQTRNLISDCKNFKSIREELERNECKYTSYEVEDVAYLSKNQLPCIAQVMNGDAAHFVMIKKISKKDVSIFDPQFGNYSLSLDEFSQVFLNKVLLKDTIGKKPDVLSTDIFKKSEKVLYFILFVLESASLCLLFSSTNITGGFIFSIVMAVVFLSFILIQNVFNSMVRKRLDIELMIPYLRVSKNKEDYSHLSSLVNESIGKMSKSVSYAAICVGVIFLIFMNSLYMSLLTLISLSFSFLRFPLEYKRNYTNRYCSIHEGVFLNELGKNDDVALSHYQKAKRAALGLVSLILASWVLEAIALISIILIRMVTVDGMHLNVFVFYFGLAMSLSVNLRQLYSALLGDHKRIRAINSLSYDLGVFLLKSKIKLDYTIKADEGVIDRNERKARVGLSRQDVEGETIKENI